MVTSLTLLHLVEYQLLVLLTEWLPHHYEQIGSRQGGQLGSLEGGEVCQSDIALLFYQYQMKLLCCLPPPCLTYLIAVLSHDHKNVENVETDVTMSVIHPTGHDG